MRCQPPSALDLDLEQLGEQALRDTKEQRDLHQRLHNIEHELSTMTHAVQMEVTPPSPGPPLLGPDGGNAPPGPPYLCPDGGNAPPPGPPYLAFLILSFT